MATKGGHWAKLRVEEFEEKPVSKDKLEGKIQAEDDDVCVLQQEIMETT